MAVKKEPETIQLGEKHTHRPNFSGGVFLIFLGILFLLSTFGVIDWSVWANIWRFWPLLLIFAGFKILLGHSMASEILMSIILVFIFGTLAVYVVLGSAPSSLYWLPQPIKDVSLLWGGVK